MAIENKESHYPDYPLMKGLQRPLEFMGLQGRYIYWAAATVGITLVCFIVAYCLAGFLAGLISAVVSLSAGAGLIIVKQRKGLHTKKSDNGVYIFAFKKRL